MGKTLKNKINLKEASKFSGYHPDYLSYLIRKKELSGQKIGRNWYVSKDSLKDYLFKRNPNFQSFVSKRRVKYILSISVFVLIVAIFSVSMEVDDGNSNLKIKKTLTEEIEVAGF